MENKKISGLDFTWDEVNSSIKNNRLLSIDLEFSRKCNLKCMYCYAFGRPFINELSYEEIIDIIKQAIDLGIKNIVNIGGGEPLLYKYYWDILEFEKKK